MQNRKFNIKKDFAELNKLENEILPMLNEIKDQEQQDKLKTYIRDLFFKQYKN